MDSLVTLLNRTSVNKNTLSPSLQDHILLNIPLFSSVIVVYLLRMNTPYLWGFIIGSGINVFLNKLLKQFFKQERPSNPTLSVKESILFYSKEEMYGMPSGHMQICAFALVYYYLLKRNILVVFVLFFLLCISFYQRLITRHHTVEQLLVGIGVGGVYAYCLFYGINRYLSKKDFI